MAHWVGSPNVAAAIPGSGAIWVVPAAGGQSRRVGPEFTAARDPLWSPDGKRLLFIGYTFAKAWEGSSLDWWVAPVDGGRAVRVGAYDALIGAGLKDRDSSGNSLSRDQYPSVPIPGCWLAAANSVVFSAQSGDTDNIWEVGISPQSGRMSGTFKN